MAKKTPEYLKEGEGYTDITLSRPFDMNGTGIKVVRMREPLVSDQEAASSVKGNDALVELTMFANLCEWSLEDLRRLPMKDYIRLRDAYLGFIG